MKRTLDAIVGLAILLSALTGCDSGPDPSHDDHVQPADLPARPVTIAVDQIRPCSMLDKEQQELLDLRASQSGTITVEGLQSSICTWLGRSGVGYNVQLIPAAAEKAVRLPGATIIQVNGFGAVENIATDAYGPTPVCQVAVDAASERTIRVQVSTTPNRAPLSNDELCRRATDAASMVMTTVVAIASR